MSSTKISGEKREQFLGYLFVFPALIYMLVLIGYPIIYNIILSLQKVDVMTIRDKTRQFVGLSNYRELFKDGLVILAIKNTLFYTIGSLVIQFVIGFALALFFNMKFRLAERLRGLMVISWMVPVTVTALLFKFMLSPSNGIIDDILIFLNIIKEPIGWLIDEETAMWGVIIANAWIGIPFNMILLNTGLSTIPEQIYESASIDGANIFKRFIYITIPMLRTAMLSVLILGFIYTFKVFDLIYVMTSGGPVNATEVLSTYSYRLSFTTYNFSQGAAVANILFVFLFIVSLGYLALINKDEVM